MGMGGKVRSERDGKRRIQSKYGGSDGSDEDYKVGDGEEFEDSEDYCSSLAGEESEDNIGDFEDLIEDEEEKVSKTSKLKRRSGFTSKNKSPVEDYSSSLAGEESEDNIGDFEDLIEDEEEEKVRKTSKLKRQSGFTSKNKSPVEKACKTKKVSYKEESDEDYIVDDEDEDDEDDKDLRKGFSSRKQNGVQKASKKRSSNMEDNDDDDYYDDDDDDVDEEEDEDFTPDEIDFDVEDEFSVVKKNKKVRRPHLQEKRSSRGRKRKRNSRIVKKSKRKPTKRRGVQRKVSSYRHKESSKKKHTVKETTGNTFGPKRRRLVLDPDSDFVDSGSSDHEYTISEEEREQVREATEFCGSPNASLRKSSLKKRSREEEILHQERKHKAIKGKDKVDDLKKEAGKQVCGICFSEEGKRTVRGTLNCCSHYFCFPCIMEWSNVESRCPLCKQRFVTISKPTRSDTTFDLRTIVIQVPERDQVYQPSDEELRAYLDPYENVICTECNRGGDDALMLLCDLCDSPAHTYCVGLGHSVPEGNWYCEGCRPTAIGSSNPQTPNFIPVRRTTNDLSGRSSSSENVREAIDLNRVPETPLTPGTIMSPSPRRSDGELRGVSSVPGAATVLGRRTMIRRINQMAGRNGGISVANWGNNLFGSQIERGRELLFQHVMAPETFAFQNTFSQGGLQDNFTPSVQSRHLLPATLSHLRDQLIRSQPIQGETFTSADGSANGTWPAGLSWNTGNNVRSGYGHPSM